MAIGRFTVMVRNPKGPHSRIPRVVSHVATFDCADAAWFMAVALPTYDPLAHRAHRTLADVGAEIARRERD